jgi:hypothetical protein
LITSKGLNGIDINLALSKRALIMKKFLVALAMVLAAIPGVVAGNGCDLLTVTENQDVVLEVAPCDDDAYYYSWYGPTFSIAGDDTCEASFVAPEVTACTDYTVYVDVDNQAYGSCTDTKCITITVCPTTCDLTSWSGCINDYLTQSYSYTGTLGAGAYVEYWLNGAWYSTGLDADFPLGVLNTPTGPMSPDNVKCNTIELKVFDNDGTKLNDLCEKQICLTFDPTASIDVIKP